MTFIDTYRGTAAYMTPNFSPACSNCNMVCLGVFFQHELSFSTHGPFELLDGGNFFKKKVSRWSGHLPTSSGRPGRVLMAAPFYGILTVLKFLGEMRFSKLPDRFCSKFAYGFPMKVQEQIPTGILPGNVKNLVKITIF